MDIGRAMAATALLANMPSQGEIIISEAMADPSAVPDAVGEYLELGNAGDAPVVLQNGVLEVDGDPLVLPRLAAEPGQCLLLCREGAASLNGGMSCDAVIPGLRLANGREIPITLASGDDRREFVVPASRNGRSWENTWDADAGYGSFLPAEEEMESGDRGSPGRPNSRSVLPPRRDLALVAAVFGEDGDVLCTVENLGREMPPRGRLRLGFDRNLDAVPDGLLSEIPLPETCSPRCTLAHPPVGGPPLPLRIWLEGDPHPGNDSLGLMPPGLGRVLRITELCPAPPDGLPEWVEIRNFTGNEVSLKSLRLDGEALQAGDLPLLLPPGGYAVLTEDAAAFRRGHGDLHLRLFEVRRWGALRNTGDTLRLTLGPDMPLDSLAYGGSQVPEATGCLARLEDGALEPVRGGAHVGWSTPGFEPRRDIDLGWTVHPRLLDMDDPEATLRITVSAGPDQEYALAAFDLEGNRVRTFCGGCAGKREFRWRGENDRDARLAVGPYVLLFEPEGKKPRKKAVVLARRL